MSLPRILLQLDTDPQPSVFDSVVAVDAGAEQLLRHGGVSAASVEPLVHGIIFTRGPKQLVSSAIFIGGSDVRLGEQVLEAVRRTFLGPLRCSVMIDSNGANTTAAAAVLAAGRELELRGCTSVVLGATGPVGQRVARLLAGQGAAVRLGSRRRERAEVVAEAIARQYPQARLSGHATADEADVVAAVDGADLLVSAGAAGIQLLSASARQASGLKVAIDLNAVPPLGLEGVEPQDKGVDRQGTRCFGAIAVGGTKMKIHQAAIRRLFESNDQVLDAEAVLAIGREVS